MTVRSGVSGRAERPVRTGRVLVLGVAVLCAVAKLVVAARTFGTNDVEHWIEFAGAVRERGPIGVYEGAYQAVYNHPPLIGWWLAGVDALSSAVPVSFQVRVPAVLADVGCAALVFEILRVRRSLRAAVLAGGLVAVSPVLFTVSGFHGNTDPVFVLFALAAAWLLVDRRWPAAAGVAIALALSVKIVPVVALPVLLLVAWQRRAEVPGRRGSSELSGPSGLRAAGLPGPDGRGGRYRVPVRFVGGAGAVFAVLWVPVLLRQWPAFRDNVLGYQGTAPQQSPWGLPWLGRELDLSADTLAWLSSSGRFVILAVCCLLPVLLAWRRPAAAPAAVGLSLVLFLLLTPTWGPQYMTWGLAAAYLLDSWAATAYSLAAGAMLIGTYTRWSGGFPWYQARANGVDLAGQRLGVLAWVALLVAAVLGARRIRAVPRTRDGEIPDPAQTPEEPDPCPPPSRGSASSSSPTTRPRRWRPRSTASPRTSAPASTK